MFYFMKLPYIIALQIKTILAIIESVVKVGKLSMFTGVRDVL